MNNLFFRIKSPPAIGLILLLIYGIFYVGNTLSPSSYGIFLNRIGAPSEGLFLGKPRAVRSDEWAGTTPKLQATVNNNFEQYNKTSPYKENLRAFTGPALPLRDWSIFFKPTLLGFHLLPPAYAFSLNHFALLALCLIGFSIFFQRLGLTSTIAMGMSALIYFSSFVQNWWTSLGGAIAFFPWIYLAIVSNKSLAVRLALFYYATTCMVFYSFYVPIFYTFALAALAFLYAFHRSFLSWRNLALFFTCCILAIFTYLFYIWDSVETLANTVYPGHRTVDGGIVSISQWISQFFPSLIMNISNEQPFIPPNVCELSAVGSYLFLLIAIFGRWQDYWKNISREEIKSLTYLMMGILFISAWMLLPIPKLLASIVFLDKIIGYRCTFSSGIMLLGIATIILKRLEFDISTRRQILFFFCIITSFLFSTLHYETTLAYESLLILVLFIMLILIRTCVYEINKKYFLHSLLTIAVINNVIIFGNFNPLQSAKPIFSTPQTTYVKAQWDKNNFNQEGFFTGSLPGATANGLGLPSITHLLFPPEFKLFHCYFPNMSAESFNNVFNRCAFFDLRNNITEPVNLGNDLSIIPLQAFTSTKDNQELRRCLGL